jgi:hypothetical protein
MEKYFCEACYTKNSGRSEHEIHVRLPPDWTPDPMWVIQRLYEMAFLPDADMSIFINNFSAEGLQQFPYRNEQRVVLHNGESRQRKPFTVPLHRYRFLDDCRRKAGLKLRIVLPIARFNLSLVRVKRIDYL